MHIFIYIYIYTYTHTDEKAYTCTDNHTYRNVHSDRFSEEKKETN